MLNGLDLFSGIGGLTIALETWTTPIAYCENDKYAQAVLLQRMWDGDISVAPIWDDVSTLRAIDLGGDDCKVDIIYGGFPCQDISVAGNGAGLAGKRSGLFYEIIRLVEETKSPWVFLENVPAIRTRGLKEVIGAFADLGYDCRWTRVSAAEIGACHLRERWFLLAHNRCKRVQGIEPEKISRKPTFPRRKDERGLEILLRRPNLYSPQLCRAGDGVPFRMDRLKGLGNSVVPLQARTAFERLIGFL